MENNSNPEWRKNVEKTIEDHHNCLYSPDGIIDRINKKIDGIKDCLPKLMKKPNIAVWIATILVVGSAVISTGYTVYSSEYKFASKEELVEAKERTLILESKCGELSKDYIRLSKTLDTTNKQLQSLVESLIAEKEDRETLNERLEKLLKKLEDKSL